MTKYVWLFFFFCCNVIAATTIIEKPIDFFQTQVLTKEHEAFFASQSLEKNALEKELFKALPLFMPSTAEEYLLTRARFIKNKPVKAFSKEYFLDSQMLDSINRTTRFKAFKENVFKAHKESFFFEINFLLEVNVLPEQKLFYEHKADKVIVHRGRAYNDYFESLYFLFVLYELDKNTTLVETFSLIGFKQGLSSLTKSVIKSQGEEKLLHLIKQFNGQN